MYCMRVCANTQCWVRRSLRAVMLVSGNSSAGRGAGGMCILQFRGSGRSSARWDGVATARGGGWEGGWGGRVDV